MLVDPMTGRKNPYCVVLFFYKKNPARKPDVQSSALGREKICDVCVGVGEEVGLRQFIFAAGSSGCGMTRFYRFRTSTYERTTTTTYYTDYSPAETNVTREDSQKSDIVADEKKIGLKWGAVAKK